MKVAVMTGTTHNPFDESHTGELLEGKLHEQFLWGGAGNGPRSYSVSRQSLTRPPAVSPDGQPVQRTKGVPQGSVIGPVMLNLFMTYAFDEWMKREHPKNPFSRYADDAVAHCQSEAEAKRLLAAIDKRLKECMLENASREIWHRVLQRQQSSEEVSQDGLYVLGV